MIWTSITNAINLINNSMKEVKGSKYDDLYKSLFIVKRDYEILKYFMSMKNQKTKIK